MAASPARSTIAAALCLGLAAAPLLGCETIRKETGIGVPTQQGALGGAAAGGIIAALADANPAWIAASIILGGVTGGAIGKYLGHDDAEKHARNNLDALDKLSEGQTATWGTVASGNSGATTVERVSTRADGTVCKRFKETVRTSAETVTKEATACRTASGWAVTG